VGWFGDKGAGGENGGMCETVSEYVVVKYKVKAPGVVSGAFLIL